MSQTPLPTDAELGILNVLWDEGPGTVAEIQEAMERERPIGYTSVLKLLQIMLDKGLVARDESSRAHVYYPEVSEADTQSRLVDRLAVRAFGGSAAKLAVRALSSERASPEEIEEVRRLLGELEERERS